jgi:hypothetical protein
LAANFFKGQSVTAENNGVITAETSCLECAVGSEVSVLISAVATNSTIGALEINLNYDQKKLQYKSITYLSGENDFSDILLEKVDQSVGVIHVEAGKQGGLINSTGRIFVATFLATDSGNVSFTLLPVDGANQNGRITLSTENATISLVKTPNSEVTTNSVDNGGTTTSENNPSSSSNSSSTRSSSAYTAAKYSKSEVNFDKLSASASGEDKICITSKIKKLSVVVVNAKPILKIQGEANASEFILTGDIWSSCITSTTVGDKRVIVSVENNILKDQTITFLSSVNKNEKNTTDQISNGNGTSSNLFVVDVKVEIYKKNDPFNRNQITDIDNILISGKSEPNAKLRIYVHSPELIIQDTTADSEGAWKVILTKSLSAGSHRVEAAVIDKYGNESKSQKITSFKVVQSNKNTKLIIIFSILLILVVISILFLFRLWKKNKIKKQTMVVNQVVNNNSGSQNNIPIVLDKRK